MVQLESVLEIRTQTVSVAVCKTKRKVFHGSFRATETGEECNVLLYGVLAEVSSGDR